MRTYFWSLCRVLKRELDNCLSVTQFWMIYLILQDIGQLEKRAFACVCGIIGEGQLGSVRELVW